MSLRGTTVVVASFIIVILSSQPEAAAQLPPWPECAVWNNVTQKLMILDNFNVSCKVNPACTGFECNGVYRMSALPIPINVLFGMFFLHCSDPLQLQVFVDIPPFPFNETVDVRKNQSNNYSLPLPGATRNIGFFSSKGNLILTLESTVSADGKQIVTTEMNVTLNVTNAGSMNTYNVVLMPKVDVPIPDCPQFSSPLPPPSTTFSPTTTTVPGPQWTGESCTWGSMQKVCAKTETCIGNNTAPGRCHCLLGLFWNADKKLCLDKPPPDQPASKDMWWIIASVFAGVVVVTAVVVMVVVKYRRYRERYGQHRLLVDHEDDTELDDPDPPMLSP